MSFKFTPSCCCSGYRCGQTYGPQTIKTADIQAYCDAMQNMVGDPRDIWYQCFIYNDESEEYRSGYYEPDGSLPSTALKDYADASDIMLASFQNCKRIRLGWTTIGVRKTPLTHFTIDTTEGSYYASGTSGHFNIFLHHLPSFDLTQCILDYNAKGGNYPLPIKTKYYPTDDWNRTHTVYLNSAAPCQAFRDAMNNIMGVSDYRWYFELGRFNNSLDYRTEVLSNSAVGLQIPLPDITGFSAWQPVTLRCSRWTGSETLSQDMAQAFVSNYNANPINLQELPLATGELQPIPIYTSGEVYYWGAWNVWGQ